MSEPKAVYMAGDTAVCESCGGDGVKFSDGNWWHIVGSTRHNFVASAPVPPPSCSEWVGMMADRGWAGNQIDGWCEVPVMPHDGQPLTPRYTPVQTMTHDEAMEFFRRGDTPPPSEWEDIPTDAESTPVNHRRMIENALADINAARLLVAKAVENEGEHKLWNLLHFAETKLNSILDEVSP